MRSPRTLLFAATLLPALAQAGGLPAARITELASPVLMALIILALGAGATAAMLVTYLVLPALSRSSALLVRRTPGRSLLYGLLTVLAAILALLLAKGVSTALTNLVILVLGLPCVVFGLIGGAATCYSLGESLLTAGGSPHHDSGPWAVGTGAALLALTNLLPILGQALCLVAGLTGLGAVVRQLLTRHRPPTTAEAMPTSSL